MSQPSKIMRAAIFVSGSGTNMENIAKCAKAGKLNCDISLVVCDNPEAYALKRAEALQLETFVINRKQFASKTDFELAINQKLNEKKIDLILLAGYMRILGQDFVHVWRWKIINIHPSFLPAFPGAHAIQDAFEAKAKETGVTVHFVDEGVDSGPVILQRKVPVLANDTRETLEARVHQMEYELYPEAIRLLAAGKVNVKEGKVKIIK